MPLDGTLYHPEDEILRVLSAAQERIREPGNWCKGHLHRTRNGRDQWCATGSFELAKPLGKWCSAWGLLLQAASELGYNDIVALNNDTDHPTVMAMFSRAIELRLANMAREGRVPVGGEASYVA